MGTGITSKEPESVNLSLDDISKLLANIMEKVDNFDNKLKNYASKSDIEYIIDIKLEALKREIENIKYKSNINTAIQTPPTYMDALSGNSITGGIRTINSHYLD